VNSNGVRTMRLSLARTWHDIEVNQLEHTS